jgi:uroporphyrinogen-III synthase
MELAPRIILTRPAAQAQVWLQDLQAHGLDVHSFPLIEITAALQPEALKDLQQKVFEDATFNACMWVSANAVYYFFQENKPFDHINRAQVATERIANSLTDHFFKMRHWATGPGTVQALVAHGVAAHQIDAPALTSAQWDSESLWAQVRLQVHAGTRLLILRGEDVGTLGTGREWLADQVRTAGGGVDAVAVYQRRAPHWSDTQRAWVQRAARDGAIWVFSSSQAIAHLVQLTALHSVDGASVWAQARCVTTHARIAQTARDCGFGVVCTSRPGVQDVALSIKSLL